jgi:tRNA (guanine10-N2)-dimethyltransferase
MYIAILGRQPALSMAELEQLYSSDAVKWFSDSSALVDTPRLDTVYLGGTQKAGRVVAELHGNWRQASMQLVKAYTEAWRDHNGKITLGISAYGFGTTSSREVQKTGLVLKSKLKTQGVSLRLIPNAEPALNTAVSHHNKLGLSDNHVELLVVRASNGRVIIAESVGAQNITALAARDQARPHTDSFVGMLPPKLARIMIHLTGPTPDNATLLDPFCGTGVVLQEALLDGYRVFGSDLSDKMVDYTTKNLQWLQQTARPSGRISSIRQADAMQYTWEEAPSLTAIVSETYLGQPFSAPPSPAKLREVRDNCTHIVSSFLRNIAPQLTPGTPLCLAVPAWRDLQGNFTHLPLDIETLGYTRVVLTHVREGQLLYYRETQVVARELLILKRS